jgi:hypothetical protein
MLKKIQAIKDIRPSKFLERFKKIKVGVSPDDIDIGDLRRIRVLSRDDRRLIRAENIYKDTKEDIENEIENINFNLPKKDPIIPPPPMNYSSVADVELDLSRRRAYEAANREMQRYETMRQNQLAAVDKLARKGLDVVGSNYGLTALDSMRRLPEDIIMSEISPYLQPREANRDMYFEKGALNYPTNVPPNNSNMSPFFPAGSIPNLGLN